MRMLYAMLLAAVLTSCSGGAGKWWEEFKANPAAQAEMVIGQVATIERVATLALAQLKPFLPADKQEVLQAKFDQAVITLSKAIYAFRSAVTAAAEAKEEKPDLAKVIADVGKAVRDLQAVVVEAKKLVKPGTVALGSGPTRVVNTSGADALDDLVAGFNGG